MERTLGPYQLGTTLGALLFGELVEATHAARSEPLAVLLLDDHLAKDHRFRGLVRLEVARAGGLRQPGIARAIEVGEHSGTLYVVFECPASASTLASRLAARDPLTPDQAAALIRRIAEGLDVAHSRRIVHGALSPASVLVGADAAAALVGMGLLTAVEESGLWESLAARTEAAYTAPEQPGGTWAVTSADGYALGRLAEEILGIRPAAGGWPGGGSSPDSVVAVVARQLAADPADRFPDCVAFAAALADALTASPEQSPALTATPEQSPDTSPDSAVTAPVASVLAPVPPASPGPLPVPAPSASSPPSAAAPAPTPTPDPVPPVAQVPSVAQEPATPAGLPLAFGEPDVASLPWEVTSLAPTPPAPLAPPASSAPTGTAPPAPPAPAGPQLPRWLIDSIDPPAAASPAGAMSPPALPPPTQPAQPKRPSARQRRDLAMEAAESHRRSRSATPLTVTRSQPTPAMLACIQKQEQSDTLTDSVLLLTDRVPLLDQLAEQYTRDGKIGPVPLGVAVSGALALLLLLLWQPALAAIFVVLVVSLYALPKVVAQLTASERHPDEAVRVTGSVSARQRVGGTGWDRFELEVGDEAALSLSSADYRRLAHLGEAVTVERPSIFGGSERVTVAHELIGATVTYLAPTRLLLDVRDANGEVIHRHPQYAGEPGDRLAASLATQTGLSRQATAAQPARPESRPTWQPTTHGQMIVVAMPPTLAGDVQQALTSAVVRAGVVNGLPLLVLIVSTITGWLGIIPIIVVFGIFGLVGAGLLLRGLQLWRTSMATSIVRVVAPVQLRHAHRRTGKSGRSDRYYLDLDDGAALRIPESLFGRLNRGGRLLEAGEQASAWESPRQNEETVRTYELTGVTVTYEPASAMLLEVLGDAGNVLFRDAAIQPLRLANLPPV